MSGIVKILDAYCPHLGANLGQGLVKGECLECPFHHWLFRGDGYCENIPYSEKGKFIIVFFYSSSMII